MEWFQIRALETHSAVENKSDVSLPLHTMFLNRTDIIYAMFIGHILFKKQIYRPTSQGKRMKQVCCPNLVLASN